MQNWLGLEGVNISVTTNKNGVSDEERFQKIVINDYISSKQTIENRCTRFETILYGYNHKTKHNTTKRSLADVLTYAGNPDFNVQQNKIDKIDKLNEKRNIGKLHL